MTQTEPRVFDVGVSFVAPSLVTTFVTTRHDKNGCVHYTEPFEVVILAIRGRRKAVVKGVACEYACCTFWRKYTFSTKVPKNDDVVLWARPFDHFMRKFVRKSTGSHAPYMNVILRKPAVGTEKQPKISIDGWKVTEKT